jgi:hypothetical protein
MPRRAACRETECGGRGSPSAGHPVQPLRQQRWRGAHRQEQTFLARGPHPSDQHDRDDQTGQVDRPEGVRGDPARHVRIEPRHEARALLEEVRDEDWRGQEQAPAKGLVRPPVAGHMPVSLTVEKP